MKSLIHLIYASASTKKFTNSEILKLLNKARQRNHAQNISGMLLYCEGSFFQILEGAEDVIASLFEVIEQDHRHVKITKIIQEPIPDRAFGDWSMAFVGATQAELNSIDGLNDFFTEKTVFTDIDEGRAKKLLQAFSTGRWRKTLK